MSEQVPIYIKGVSLIDFRGFRNEHGFRFVDEKNKLCKWTVFLGNNNTGKTNLLKAIASLEPISDRSGKNLNFYPIGCKINIFPKEKTVGSKLGLHIQPDLSEKDLEFENCLISYTNTTTFSTYLIGNQYVELKNLSIFGYGVVREIEKKGINTEEIELLNSDNLFNNTKLINFEDWLFQLDYAANNLHSPKENRMKAGERRDILKLVLSSEVFPEINDIRFISDKDLNNYIEFQTEDGWRRMSELGYGYQATLSWMADFCKKMFDKYSGSTNPLNEPAVLLIDEIDLHLHPQWQRGLIKSLSDIFPLTQFIVTTHSPFIIQSMENVNLYTLNRVGDHTEVTHLGNKSYIGWKIEEILSEVMGLEDNINTDVYQALIKQFDKALDKDDYKKGKEAYDKLMQILHPQSAERKLLDIQFTQLSPTND